MKNEKEIREFIERETENYKHVLDCGPATTGVNAPRALMQLAAIAMLNALYWVLGEERPKFECDDGSKIDH